jgi:arginyl-tRNA synthetase
VRCNSIIKKAKAENPIINDGRSTIDDGQSTFDYGLQPAEIQLIDLISRFPAEVQRAAVEYKPLVIASIAYDIAKAFAAFYDACPVVQAEAHVREARLRLVTATKQTLANGLALLGITAPEVM